MPRDMSSSDESSGCSTGTLQLKEEVEEETADVCGEESCVDEDSKRLQGAQQNWPDAQLAAHAEWATRTGMQ